MEDPTILFATVAVVSMLAAASTALKSTKDRCSIWAQWLRDASFGCAVCLLIYPESKETDGHQFYILGLAILTASSGEKARKWLMEWLGSVIKNIPRR